MMLKKSKQLLSIGSILIGLILVCSIGVINSYEFNITNNLTEPLKLPTKYRTKIDYNPIWDEYIGAPSNQPGDDSLIFGPSFGPYHNYSELVFKLKNLNDTYPEIIDLFSIGKTYFGREIYCVRITNELIKIPKTEVVIVGQHHAQEQITVENALYFIDKVVYEFFSPSDHEISPQHSIRNLLNTKAIYVIPSLNIDGAELMSQFPWQRKTARPIDEDKDFVKDEDAKEIQDINNDGFITKFHIDYQNPWYEGIDLNGDGIIGNDEPGGVDPNRNYPYKFGEEPGSSDNPSSWKYHGSKAFSENCTARFCDFVLQRNFVTAVSLHSGMEYPMILSPWEHSGELPTGDDYELYSRTGKKLQELTGFTHIFGSYSVSGEWGDWMYGRADGTPLALTFETYGNTNAFKEKYNDLSGIYSQIGVWDFCNPPADKVIDNCVQTYPGLLFMAQEAPYLSIQTRNVQVGNLLKIKVNVTNLSEYVRTNCSINLEYRITQISGLTLIKPSKSPIKLDELKAQASFITVLTFEIEQTEYKAKINLRAYGSKIGDAVMKYDLNPSIVTSESSNSTSLVAIIGFIIFITILRKKRRKIK